MKKLKYFVLIVFLLVGCSTSEITSSWKPPGIQPRHFDKILVMALSKESDRSLREKMEEHLVGDLMTLGYNAICACDEFGPKTFENLSEKQALDKLDKNGIDGVLTVVLLDKTKEQYYVPERISYSPYAVYRDRFWGYYTTMQYRIYSPGYYAIETKYFWESNLYDLKKMQLLYSVQTKSFDPSSADGLAHEYGQLIVKNMVKNNVLLSSGQTLKAF